MKMVKEHGIRMKTSLMLCVLALPVLFLTGSATAGGMRFPIGISYASGFQDLADAYEDSYEMDLMNQGFFFVDADVQVWPVGLSLHPYYQWDNGLRLGAGIGPVMLIYGDVDHFQLPFNVNVGYTFMPDGPVSPYLIAGPSYHFASGDYVDGSNLGFVAGAGIELLKSRKFALAVQATYDSAEVDIEEVRPWPLPSGSEGIKAAEFVISLLFIFK